MEGWMNEFMNEWKLAPRYFYHHWALDILHSNASICIRWSILLDVNCEWLTEINCQKVEQKNLNILMMGIYGFVGRAGHKKRVDGSTVHLLKCPWTRQIAPNGVGSTLLDSSHTLYTRMWVNDWRTGHYKALWGNITCWKVLGSPMQMSIYHLLP